MNAVTLQCKSIRIVLLLDDYGSSMSVLFVLRRTCSGGRTASTGSCTRLWGLSIGGVLKGKADESSRIAMNNLSWREFLFTVEMGSKSSSLRFLRLPVGVLPFLSIFNNFQLLSRLSALSFAMPGFLCTTVQFEFSRSVPMASNELW